MAQKFGYLQKSQKSVLRSIFGPTLEGDAWRARKTSELGDLYKVSGAVERVETGDYDLQRPRRILLRRQYCD